MSTTSSADLASRLLDLKAELITDHGPDKDASLPLRPPLPSNGPIKFEPPATRSGAPPTACFLGPIVTIEVGTAPAVKFFVQEALLCHYSAFFHTALNGRFKEAETKEISLPEDDPIEFAMAVHWLYSGEADGTYHGSFETDTGHPPTPLAKEEEEEEAAGETRSASASADTVNLDAHRTVSEWGPDVPEPEKCTNWFYDDDNDTPPPPPPPAITDLDMELRTLALAGLWILGDKLRMPALQNAATKTLLALAAVMRHDPRTAHAFPAADLFEHVYENTLAGAPLRALVVDMALVTRREERVCALVDEAAKDVRVDVSRDVAKRAVHFWLAGGAAPWDPHAWLRESWRLYRVDGGGGDDVVGEDDLFAPEPGASEFCAARCAVPQHCKRGPWGVACRRCRGLNERLERLENLERDMGLWPMG